MDNDAIGILGPLFALVAFGFVLAVIAFTVFVWYRIIGRTGLNGWLALLMIIPLANVVMILILAFGDWPVLRELESLRRQLGDTAGGRTSY